MGTLHTSTVFVAAAALTLGTVRAQAQAFKDAAASLSGYAHADIMPSQGCERLAKLELADVVQLSARSIAAEGAAPAHCRVSGVLQPEIAFEVNLPAAWNGRFYMIGNGGLAGEAPDDPEPCGAARHALSHGFVMAGTNTGHYARKEPSGTFVLSNPQKAIDYAYRAVHLTAIDREGDRDAAITSRSIEHSYWNSCCERRPTGAARGRALSRRISTASSRTRHGWIRRGSRSARSGISARSPTRRCRPRRSRSSRTPRWRNATRWTA